MSRLVAEWLFQVEAFDQNNYKEIFTVSDVEREARTFGKKGQVAVFVIIAVVIVVGGILVYLFVPQVRTAFSGDLVPSSFLKSCVEEDVRANVELLASQGGYSDPEGYIDYRNRKVKYLCYTSQYFLPCNVQQPLIKRHFEIELENMIRAKAESCVAELVQEYEGRGFNVNQEGSVDASVEIVPGAIQIFVEAPMTVSKEDTTSSYREFRTDIRSEMYDLLITSTAIVNFEATYGNTDTLLFQQYYPNLNIYKDMKTDGTTIYTVVDVTTDESFTFASRSLAWDGGYGID